MRSLLTVMMGVMVLSAFGEKGYLFSYFSDNPSAATTLVGKNATAKALAQLEGLRSSLTHAQAELRAALWTMTEEAEGPADVSRCGLGPVGAQRCA